MIEPTPNDVLSGRGASFNRHPGNENFRRMLEQHREVYSQSVKVRKVAITKSIVEAIYSMEPPGRFLRKCATTGEWEELSKKEADNKAAQAMAYAVRDLTKRGPSRGFPSQIHVLRNVQESEPSTDWETADNSRSPSLQLQRLLPSLQQSRSVNILPDQNPTNNAAQVASLNELAQSLNRGQQQLILQQQQQQQSVLSLLGQQSLQPQMQHASASVPLNPSLSAHLQRALVDDFLRQSLQISQLPNMQSITNRQQDLLSLTTRGISQNQAEMSPLQQTSMNQLQHRLDALLQDQLLSSLTQQQQQSLLSLLGQRSLQPQMQHASASVPLDPSLSAHLQRALVDNFLRQSLLTAQLPDMQSITNRQQDLLSLTTRGISQNQAEMSPLQQTSVNQLQHRLDSLLQDQLLSSLTQQQQQSLLSLLGQRSLQPQMQHASASVPLDPSLSAHLQRALVDNFLRQSLLTAQLPDMQSITNRQQDLLSLTTRGISQNQAEMSPLQQTSVNQLQHRLDSLLQDQLLSSLQQNQWLLQYPSRPLDLLHQALQGSQSITNRHPRLSRTSTSSSSTRQRGGVEDEEKQDERK